MTLGQSGAGLNRRRFTRGVSIGALKAYFPNPQARVVILSLWVSAL